jgi:hypothetical protein
MRRARLSVPCPSSSSSPTDMCLPLCVVEVEEIEAEVVEKGRSSIGRKVRREVGEMERSNRTGEVVSLISNRRQ